MRSLILHTSDTGIVNRRAFDEFFKEMPKGRWLVDVKNINSRTLPQNAYLHGVLIPEFRKALNNVGYDVKNDEQAKLVMKNMFLSRTIEREDGAVLEYVEDTRNLTTTEMSTLVDDVVRFSAEHLGYVIPLPNEQTQIFK